jgi:hypothetical protein
MPVAATIDGDFAQVSSAHWRGGELYAVQSNHDNITTTTTKHGERIYQIYPGKVLFRLRLRN